jgi:3-oxoadipate enol-lactonase
LNVIDRGDGTPVVVIPGIQGRWEWMKPTIDALAERCRVITFSLADEPSSGGRFDESLGFGSYVEQVREALDATGIRQAAICGVSYGGLIAAAFAARHPDRASSVVLVSALPPSWRPDARVRFYLRAPRLLAPLFVLASLRMYREIAVASAGVARGLVAATRLGWLCVRHMFSPDRMARRVHLLESLDLQTELVRSAARVSASPTVSSTTPALIITGEPTLDRVVPVSATHEYLQLWPRADVATIPRTGHLGSMTRPEILSRLVVPFAERAAGDVDARRRVG